MKKITLLGSVLLCIFFLASCGTKPVAETDNNVEAPVVTDEVADEVSDDTTKESIEEIKARIEKARASAIDAGAKENAGELLARIDSSYDEFCANPDGDGSDIEKQYLALSAYLNATKAKQKIDDNNFADYSRTDYDKGVAALSETDVLITAKTINVDELLSKSQDAYSDFNKVLIIAYKKLAKDERVVAYNAKKDADSVKAGVSEKEKYTEGVDSFRKGDSLYSMQNPEAALSSYSDSKDIFTELFVSVSEKRAVAQKAIDDAKKRVEQSKLNAENADKEAPITEAVDGIEDEDAVLLEEDSFEDPAAAEIEVEETIEEELITTEEPVSEEQ